MSIATLAAPSPRRRVSKSPRIEAAKPIKVSVYLSPESAERLGIHGVKTRLTQSAIVDGLIQEHLRRFVVSDRAKPSVPGDLADANDIGAEG
jgi:hypothetical protein